VKIHTTPLFLLLILSLIIFKITPVKANPLLEITVKTDKQHYYAKDTVQVYGNLTLDGALVTNGIVGIQIQTPQDELLTIRTLSTGNPPPETPYVFIEYVAPCDQNGIPKFSFEKGTVAYFKISVVNQDIQTREALMTINTYYADNTPFGFASIQTTISPQSNPTFIISIPIPQDAFLGTATVYANAYANWPKLLGTPYCSEVNATFQITDGTLGAASQTTQNPLATALQQGETGNFNISFRLAKNAPPGNYTVYTASRYLGESTFKNATFQVFILGDIDEDNDIDYIDLFLFLQCYKGEFNPKADLDFDGDIDYQDLFIFLQNYKTYR